MDFNVIPPKRPPKKTEPPATAAAPPPPGEGSFMEEMHHGVRCISYTNTRSWRMKFGDDYYSNGYYDGYRRQMPMGPPPSPRMHLPSSDNYSRMSHQLALPPPDYHQPDQMDYHYGPPAYPMNYHYGPDSRRDPYEMGYYGPPRGDLYPMDYPCGRTGWYPCYGGGYWGK